VPSQHANAQPADPVGIPEIASRLGVARATVDQWRFRGLLPDSQYVVGGRPAWEWGVIEAWARDTGRLGETKTDTKGPKS
jgi:predicted DNA-binding transcriptional regulator AlpA